MTIFTSRIFSKFLPALTVAAVLVTSIPAEATGNHSIKYCKATYERLEHKLRRYEAKYSSYSTRHGSSTSHHARHKAHVAMYRRYLVAWKYSCIKKVKCDKYRHDDFCGSAISPNS